MTNKDDHSMLHAQEYSCKVIEDGNQYKVYKKGHQESSHLVNVPSRAALEEARLAGVKAAAPRPPPYSWLRPPEGIWSCDGGCLMPQRVGAMCKHAKRAAQEAFKTSRDDEALATRLGYASFYQVEHVHECLAPLVMQLVQVKDVGIGPDIQPIARPAKQVLDFDPSGGGRPVARKEDDRKRSLGEVGSTAKSRKAASAASAAAPVAQVRCSQCHEPGHNKATCAKRARLSAAAAASVAPAASEYESESED